MELANAVAIVTGAGVGIGAALAERLAAEGAAVLVADTTPDAAAETLTRIHDAGGNARAYGADLRAPDAVADMVATACDWGGGIDVLCNNAGGGAEAPAVFPHAAEQDWSAVTELNLTVPMRAIQAVLPHMSARGNGAVVNTGSVAGLGWARHRSPEYAAAKAGLLRLTATLARLADDTGVRVNAVAPDWVATPRALAELHAMPAAERAAQPPLVPLPLLCDVVVELICDDSIAGRVVRLDRDQPPRWVAAVESPDVGSTFDLGG